MGLYRNDDNGQSFVDFNHDDVDEITNKKRLRQLLEKKLERKRLKEELEYFDGELDGDFDWDYLDK